MINYKSRTQRIKSKLDSHTVNKKKKRTLSKNEKIKNSKKSNETNDMTNNPIKMT